MQVQTILTSVVVLVATTVYCHHTRCSDHHGDTDFKEAYDGCQFEINGGCMTVKSCPTVCFNKANRSMGVGQRWKELNDRVKCKCVPQSERPTPPPGEVPYPPTATCTLKTGCKHPMTGEYVKKMEKIMHNGHSCACVKGPDTSDPYLKTYWHLTCKAPTYARCKVMPNPAAGPIDFTGSGTIDFKQSPTGHTHIKYDIRGFNTADNVTKYGFHLHIYGDIVETCKNTGAIYNPKSRADDHGYSKFKHVGMFGKLIREDDNGNVSGLFEENVIKLTGPTSVMGRSIVIVARKDALGRVGDHVVSHGSVQVACCSIFATDGKYWEHDH